MKDLLITCLLVIALNACENNKTNLDLLSSNNEMVTSIDSTNFMSYLEEVRYISDKDSFLIDSTNANYEIVISQLYKIDSEDNCFVCNTNRYNSTEIYLSLPLSAAGHSCDESGYSPFFRSFISHDINYNDINCWMPKAFVVQYNNWSRFGVELDENDSSIVINESGTIISPYMEESNFYYLPLRMRNIKNTGHKYGWLKFAPLGDGIAVYDISLTTDFIRTP